MQSIRSTLLFVLGIPAGYLPLLAVVELGPGEVGLTLSLLTACGCSETLRAERTWGPSRSGRIAWRVARIAVMYACCVVIGFLISVWSTNAAGPGAVQRSLFGEFRDYCLSWSSSLPYLFSG